MAGEEQQPGTGAREGADDPPAEAAGSLRASRRNFIGGASVFGAAAAYDIAFAHARAITGVLLGGVTSVIGEIGSILETDKPSFSTLLRRREDFLLLRIDGYNLVRRRQHLVREFNRAAYLVITHQPQHVIEEAFLEPPVAGPKAPGNNKALLAYPSRLAFQLPDGTDSIPLTLAGLLDWAALDPSLSPFAAYEPFALIDKDISKPGHGGTTPVRVPTKPPKWPPTAPAETETAIELPWHLVISPTTGGAWSHPKNIVQARGWAELWHTRLAAGAAETAADGGAIRGIWTYDLRPNGKSWFKPPTQPPNVENPFLTSLNPSDRYEIVEATSDFSFGGRADVTANKLWLSARGGFLDSIGEWDSTKLNLAEWRHLATLGRDQYVKVVYYGFLYPFGHRVVLTKITERMFEKVDGQIVATSRQIHYLTVKQPDKSYDPADTFGVANNSRDFPFRSLELKTLRTPDLSPMSTFVSGIPSSDVFVPKVAGAPFLWHFVGTDWIGQQVAFTAPAVFVIQSDGFDSTNSMKVRNAYNALPVTAPSIRIGQFTGSEVAFAASHTAGDTNLGVQSMTFGAGAGTGGSTAQFMASDQPICYPNLAQAAVVLSAAAQASGGGLPSANPVVSYHPTFVSDDFNSAGNQGNLFMEIGAATQPGMNFSGGSSGGVMLPNIQLSGLSRSLGPIAGDVSNILGGKFDPSSVFSDLNATILGGVKLIDLIKLVTGLSGDSPSTQAMQILYSTVGSAGMAADRRYEHRRSDEQALLNPPVPTTRTTHFSWSPDITDNPIVSKDSDSSNPLSPAVPFAFNLDGTVTTDLLNPANSKFKLVGTLKGFDVSLMDNSGDAETFIAIHFKELTFTAASGQKSTVTVDIGGVDFLGVLDFIEQLEEFMDFSGDGGPKITVDANGITADLSVALPDIAVGIFSLSNISVDAGFNLPFANAPARFRFSFATQDDPFTLSVAIFGGGGFFGIAIGTDGVELIQASFDFGAMASINLGVASGSVSLTAGIYFAYGQIAPPATTVGCILTGFVKLDGSLSILGIITLSLEFDLSLTYEDLGGVSSVTGTATLTVGVSVFCFSFSVSVTAQKTFGGGANNSSVGGRRQRQVLSSGSDVPPTFADQMSSTDWNNYCSAFAVN